MDIVELLNRLATERMTREILQRAGGVSVTYTCGDTEILATAIEVLS